MHRALFSHYFLLAQHPNIIVWRQFPIAGEEEKHPDFAFEVRMSFINLSNTILHCFSKTLHFITVGKS